MLPENSPASMARTSDYEDRSLRAAITSVSQSCSTGVVVAACFGEPLIFYHGTVPWATPVSGDSHARGSKKLSEKNRGCPELAEWTLSGDNWQGSQHCY
jgi:hypothetical protein